MGADRALKRLALQRVRDIDLWKVAAGARGRAGAEARAKVADADLQTTLLVVDDRRPAARLAQRARAGRRARARRPALSAGADRGAGRHPARRALRPAPARPATAPWSTARAWSPGSSRSRSSHVPQRRPRPRSRSGADLVRTRGVTARSCSPSSRSATARPRTPAACPTTASARTGSSTTCDRYVDPFFEHVVLTLVSVAIGFVIAFTLALIAHRRQWLIGPITPVTGALYTIPSVAFFFLLQPFTGRGQDHRDHRAGLLHAADHLPQRDDRAWQRARRGQGRRARDGPDRRTSCCGGSSCRWPLPEILAGLRIATTTTVGLAALAFLAGAGGLGGRSRPTALLQVQRGRGRRPVRAAGGRARPADPRRAARRHPLAGRAAAS